MTPDSATSVEAAEVSTTDPVELKYVGSVFTTRDRAMGMIFDLEREHRSAIEVIDFDGVRDVSAHFLGHYFHGIRIHNDVFGSGGFPELRNVPEALRGNVEFGLWAAHLDADTVTIEYQ